MRRPGSYYRLSKGGDKRLFEAGIFLAHWIRKLPIAEAVVLNLNSANSSLCANWRGGPHHADYRTATIQPYTQYRRGLPVDQQLGGELNIDIKWAAAARTYHD